MKKHTLTNLTDAHGWIGIIISSLLFTIFFAGSVSLFRDEIFQWSVQPTQAVEQGEILSVSEIMQLAIAGRPFNAKEHLTIIPPSEENPYYQAYVDLIEEEAGREYIGLLMDPVSGKVVGEIDQFILAEFIYHLHRDLNIPYGVYLLGFVTLFFFFMLLSGILIHARKLIGNFFQYRTQSNSRSKLLDMHNVIGTISLPFTLMYALSGLIFNLVIIYQIAFAVILYKGDQDALLKDAGVRSVEVEWQSQPYQYQNIDQLVERYSLEFGHMPVVIRMYNYGDKSTAMHLIGLVDGMFAQRYEVALNLIDDSIIFKDDAEQHSEVRHGIDTLSELHFGGFAGLDLRFIYFILGIAVCALIVTGNMLWIEKRQKRLKASQRSVKIVTHTTLISTLGVGLACCVAFLAERLLPVTLVNRADYVIYAFVACLVLSAIVAVFVKKQTLLVGSFALASAVLLLTILSDWMMYAKNLQLLWQAGELTAFGTQAGLGFVATFFAVVAYKLTNKKRSSRTEINSKSSSDNELAPA
ncbi:PepSY-associated TM helix domain-containing protein [Cognaticolwellia mytili]|uniref:PepSY-associated TM helix domain-containing protein n=1 Tax=Cognaticolwellia mytili TaxID=1888913 RepID=UPI000A1701D9|nr:PepSY-associated TM helix domain-containing protein [Cognaticolwellia mytili]